MDHNTKTNKQTLILIISLVIVLLAGQKFSSIFQFDRSLIIEGEYWRILTCHFVHTGWGHLLLNLVGALFILRLFAHLYSPFTWFTGTICCMIGISFSFLIFCPTLEWYVGLSGLLHGLLMMGIIGEMKNGNRFYCLVLLAIFGKLATEYFNGPSELTGQLINFSIITSAHLAGAITGGITACYVIISQKFKPGHSFGVLAKYHLRTFAGLRNM